MKHTALACLSLSLCNPRSHWNCCVTFYWPVVGACPRVACQALVLQATCGEHELSVLQQRRNTLTVFLDLERLYGALRAAYKDFLSSPGLY